MRIIIDLDGVICKIKQPGETYADLEPVAGAAEKLRSFRAEGHTIVIYTARNMATYEGNLGKIMKNVGLVTLEWLEKYDMEYDEIYFGKPNGHVYIDDRAVRFQDWDSLGLDILLKESRER